MTEIKEPFVTCMICHVTVSSKQAIKATNSWLFVNPDASITTYPPGAICARCLEKKGMM